MRLLDLRALHVLLDGGGHLSAHSYCARPNLVGNVAAEFPRPLLQRCGTPTVAPDRPIHEVGHPSMDDTKRLRAALITKLTRWPTVNSVCSVDMTAIVPQVTRIRDSPDEAAGRVLLRRRRRLEVVPFGLLIEQQAEADVFPGPPDEVVLRETEWPRWRRVVKDLWRIGVGRLAGRPTLVGSVSDS